MPWTTAISIAQAMCLPCLHWKLEFTSFVKLVNADSPEPHQTPPIHLSMLDKLDGEHSYMANLCFRAFIFFLIYRIIYNLINKNQIYKVFT